MQPRLKLFGIFLVFSLAGAACSDPPAMNEECNPLGGNDPACMYPWPSMVYAVPADTPTGFQVALDPVAMPVSTDGDTPLSPARFNRWDGFSPSGIILAAFPGGVSADGLPSHVDPAASVAADSPIILLNMDTGERAPFFAEIDMGTRRPEKRALIIRPMKRLEPASRYAVAIRNTVKGPGGADLPISPGFQAILDGSSYNHPAMEILVPRYPEIFAALEAEGVAKSELVLAWDFVTASDENLTHDLMTMRTQALDALGQDAVNSTFDIAITQSNTTLLYRYLKGTYKAPNFLTAGSALESVMNRDAAGNPALDGWYDAPISVVIPKCVETAQLPVPVIILGHGIFGTADGYLKSGFLQSIANDECAVILGTDYIGFTDSDQATVIDTLWDVSKGGQVTEKLGQAVINFITLAQLTKGPFVQSDLFKINNNQIIDPNRVYYFGISLGGIMGGTYMAYDPTITRGVLGVAGGVWSLLIERSAAWSLLQATAQTAYPDQYDYQLAVALLGMWFEPYDSITTAANLTGEVKPPLAGSPAKQILIYETFGDSLVSNLTTEMVSRTAGFKLTAPSVLVPYGLSEGTGTMTSGLTIYDEDPTPLPPLTNEPPGADNGTHSGVNQRAAIRRQLHDFITIGEVTHQCFSGGQPAPCDCTTGACN